MIKLDSFDTRTHLILQEPDPARKDKDYYRANVYAMYSEWCGQASTVGYNGVARIDLLRAFADGRQPDDPLRTKAQAQKENSPILSPTGVPYEYTTEPAEQLPMLNVHHEAWQVFSPANKIVEAVMGKLVPIDYEIACDPLDYGTKQKVENAKLFAWQYKQNQAVIGLMEQVAGVQADRPQFVPEEPEDLDLNEERFLPDHAMYVEQVVKHAFDLARWQPVLAGQFLRDVFVSGEGCIRDAYDPETGKVYPIYVDPRDADIQPSKHPDHSDSERAWSFDLWNLSRVRQYFPDKDEKWFKDVAGWVSGRFGNPLSTEWNAYNVLDPYGRWMYDRYKVPVMHCEWIDIDKTKEVVGTNDKGRRSVKQVPLNSKVAESKTVRFSEDRRRYEAYWVMNTDDVFEYGPAHENSPYLTYHWYSYPGKSKIEQILPVLKQIEDLWDKYRELLRNAKGKGDIINVDKISGTSGTDTPQVAAKKAYRRFLATYTLFVRGVNINGLQDNSHPYTETEGGMGALFQEIMLAFKNAFEMIEVISGINPLTYGQSADPNAPVTTTEYAMAATGNVLRPVIDSIMVTKQRSAENIARWAVMLIRGNEFSRQAYARVVGDYGIQALIAASRKEADYGFKMIPRPQELEKKFILQMVQTAITPAAGGEREISTADANRIIAMVASGTPTKTINYYFEQARKRQEQSIMRRKMMLMQQQSQLNQQDSALAAQNAAALADKQHAQDMALQELKNQGILSQTQVQEGIRFKKEEAIQDKKNRSDATEQLLAGVSAE